jgi:choline dehydrogenase-like flavoprotein
MRIDDLASLPSDVALKADLLIIGAGPAGLTLARELGGSGINVIVCESGTVGDHQKYHDLNQVEITPDDHFDPCSPVRVKFFTGTNPVWTPDVEPYGARIRAYGGSTAYWGGKAATFDENDFSQRDWVPHSGWPLYRSEIARYFDRAGAMINIGPNIYDDHLWPLLGKPKPEPRLDDEKLRTTFWQFSRSHKQRTDIVRFERDHREIPGDNLRTITNATVTRIDL